MGYFQNTHANWQDYVSYADIERTCEWCGKQFIPRSPNQKRHSYDSDDIDSIACVWEYELEHMGPRQYLNYVGMTKKEYIKEYGIEQYELIVLQRDGSFKK